MGMSWLNQLNTKARQMAPILETTHPIKLMLPKIESDAGNMNIPEAIVLPITSEVLVHIPMRSDLSLDRGMTQASKSKWQFQPSMPS